MIKLKNATIEYKENQGIFDINFEFKSNKIYSILGSSGCGKTTLLSSILGFRKLDLGIVEFDKEKIKLSYVPQQSTLFQWYNVRKNIELGIINHIEVNKDEKIDLLLNELELKEVEENYVNKISGGQKQRTSIARALISNPDVILCDEPTAALDAFNKEKLQDLFLKLYNSRKFTLIMVTHSIDEAVFLSDEIIIMNKGKIVKVVENNSKKVLNYRNDIEYFNKINLIKEIFVNL